MAKSISQYFADYPVALLAIQDYLAQSNLPRLEDVALRFTHALEEKLLDLKEGNEKIFLSALLTKATNEMFATVGALRNGGWLACHHHARAVVETFAALDHVYCTPLKKERKLRKFIEYDGLAKYQHYTEWKEKLEKNEITQKEFNQDCHVLEEQFEQLKTKIPDWEKIWKIEAKGLSKINNWHYSASIEGLFQSSENTRHLWPTYEMLCHATHISPLAMNMSESHLLIGFPRRGSQVDFKKLNQPINGTILGAQQIAICLSETVKAGLIEGVLDWVPED